MSRYIDADALMPKLKFIREAEHQIYGKGSWGFASKCITAIEDAPTIESESCEDAVSRNAVIQKLNTMDRYVSEELRLCDTDKKFPKNEVFIVDDVYEEIVENLPSAQPDLFVDADKLKRCRFEYINACKIVAHPTKDTSKSDIHDAYAVIKALHPIFGDVEF